MEDLKDKRILIIVESPNKVKTISSILKKAGYKKAVVMASVGHISGIKDAKGSYKNTGIYPKEDFRMNLAVSQDKKDVVAKLQEQVKAADMVYIMTDPDREGAQIAWSLVKFLKLKPGKYKRAVTHEITPKMVVAAIENPIALEENLIEAAQSRMILDKMVGYALSPVARNYIGAKSVGRCQSAGLKLVVDREKEITDFVPEKYFELYLDFTKNNTAFRAKYAGTADEPKTRVSTQAEINAIKQGCTADYVVNDIVKKEKYQSPKPPFCTATFQQEVSTQLGLSVKSAMSCAQKLFEGISVEGEHIGLITYHRTDSTEFAPEFLPTLENYIKSTYGNVYTTPRQGKKSETDQDGHECLRCVDPAMTPEKVANYIKNNDLLVKVYRIIWQRTIAAAMPNAKISETTYNIHNNHHRFCLVSKEIIDPGFKQVYSYQEEDDSKDEFVKETFKEGEVLQNCSLSSAAKQTLPPPRYKEATFVKELQKRGIGRPSTFAGILDTILSSFRGYCTLENKEIVPTQRGIQLSNFLDRAFSGIINLDYTKEMEQKLDQIAEGKLSKSDFLNSFYSSLEEAIANNKETSPLETETKICPKCGAVMRLKRSRFGKLFYGCSRYPECDGILPHD